MIDEKLQRRRQLEQARKPMQGREGGVLNRKRGSKATRPGSGSAEAALVVTTVAPHVGSMSNMPGKHTHTNTSLHTHTHTYTRTYVHTCIKVINMPSNVTCTNYNNNSSCNNNALKHVTKLCVYV